MSNGWPDSARMTGDDIARLRALIQRVEAATGPDRVLDAEIACAMCRLRLREHGARPDPMAPGCVRDIAGSWSAPEFTDSLDAAVLLVPAGRDWMTGTHQSAATAVVTRAADEGAWLTAATPALALVAAALLARLAEVRDDC
jgi:hypothetical protein